MKLETIGNRGENFTLVLHWEATVRGQQGGMAFQTTEFVPLSDSKELAFEEAKNYCNEAWSRKNCEGYLQGARVIGEKNNKLWIIKYI